MIPIRNKRKTLQVTVDEMRNFALSYVEKYAPSKQQLRTYLLKKYLKLSVPNVKKQDVTNLIDIVLSDLIIKKYTIESIIDTSKKIKPVKLKMVKYNNNLQLREIMNKIKTKLKITYK